MISGGGGRPAGRECHTLVDRRRQVSGGRGRRQLPAPAPCQSNAALRSGAGHFANRVGRSGAFGAAAAAVAAAGAKKQRRSLFRRHSRRRREISNSFARPAAGRPDKPPDLCSARRDNPARRRNGAVIDENPRALAWKNPLIWPRKQSNGAGRPGGPFGGQMSSSSSDLCRNRSA